jgi:carbon storage regulator CsrA
MLVLSRKLGERVCLQLPSGDVIWVSIEFLGSHNIKLGIEAPANVEVLREELMKEKYGTPVRNRR